MMIGWLVAAPVALAQSSPGLTSGQVPTAAQWNSYFAAKTDYQPGGCSVAAGCTGVNSLPTHTLVVGNGVNPVNNTGAGTAGYVLISGGLAADPSWQQLFSGSFTIGHCLKALSINPTIIADSGGNCSGTGSPGGSDTQVQVNVAGSFGGTSNITVSGSTTSLSGTVNLPGGGSLTSTQATFAKPVASSLAAGGAGDFVMASGSRFGCLNAVASNSWQLGSSDLATDACVVPVLTWGYSGGLGNLTLNVGPTIDGTVTINDSTGLNLVGTFAYGPTPTWTLPPGGTLILNNGVGLSQDSIGVLDIGNGGYHDKSARVNLATLSATANVLLPDGGSLSTTLDTLQSPVKVAANNAVSPIGNVLSGQYGIINNSWGAGAAGLSFQGGTQSGVQIAPGSSYATAWNMQFFNSMGMQVFGIENAERDNNLLQVGAVRFCSSSVDCLSQVIMTDGMVQGAITGLTGLVGGSGYTNGTYTDVAVTGGHGVLALLDFTVVGGVVTSAALHTPPRGGAAFQAGDVLTLPGGSPLGSGTGFQISVNAVTTGVNGAPAIVMNGISGHFMGLGGSGPTTALPLGENYLRLGGITDDVGDAGGDWSYTSKDAFNFELAGGVVVATIGSGAWTRQAEIVGSATVPGMAFVTAPTAPGTLGTPAPISVSFVRYAPTTVAGLATADPTPADGDSAYVTDATAPTFNGTLTGGGTVHTRVHYDGSASAWKAG